MSALAASAIPNIFGGFAPFPNTIATALLAYQSEAIGYGFGIKFQYAKRKIGAMTNEEFNGLTEFTLGQIVEAHTTELTNRMVSEMPKWIEIQKHYIEAGVQVEVMKANRTPSAWAEIITAFTGAAGQQIVASINGLDSTAKASILSISPILAMIYYLSQTGTSSPPPETELPEGDFHIFTINVTGLFSITSFGTEGLFILREQTLSLTAFTGNCTQLNLLIDQLGDEINNIGTLISKNSNGDYVGTSAELNKVRSHLLNIEQIKLYLQGHADNGCTQ